MPLKVIIVGAGIAGLALAVGLARQGHKVLVYERRTVAQRDDQGSGIQLQPNVSRILQEWGMLDDLRKVAHDNESATVRDQHGTTIVKSKYGGHAWYVLRGVVKNLFLEHAVRAGAQVIENATVVKVEPQRPAIVLKDGTVVEGDLLVGADGSGSIVRQALFPSYKPKVMDKVCWQAALPLQKVRDDPVLCTLLDEHHSTITLSLGRSIFSSPAPFQHRYEFHMVDHGYTLEQDPHPQMVNGLTSDLAWLRNRFSDHGSALCKALSQVTTVLKWRFIEATDVPSLFGNDGRVVLIGDSIHAMMPFSGQGSAMGIEDAAVLSELLAESSAGDNLADVMTTFTRIRRPRFERVVDLARFMESVFGMDDPDMIEGRNALLAAGRPLNEDVEPDGDEPYGSPAFQVWLDEYDVFKAVKEGVFHSEPRTAKL